MVDFCDTGAIKNSITASFDALVIAALVSTIFLAISYAISFIWKDEKMKIWVKQELWNLVLNGIVIVFVLGIIDMFSGSITSATNVDSFMSLFGISKSFSSYQMDSGCLFQIAYDYTIKLVVSALKEYAVILWAIPHIDFLSSMQTTVCLLTGPLAAFCLLGGTQVAIQPFAYVSWLYTIMNSTLRYMFFTSIFLFAFSQAALLKLFLESNLLTFFSYILVLRVFPFTRSFANVVFATLFAFLVFYPMIVVLEFYVLGLPPIYSLGVTDESHSYEVAGVSTSLQKASNLETEIGTFSDILAALLSPSFIDYRDLWSVSYVETDDGYDLRISKIGNHLISFSKLVAGYAHVLFRIVLFGSINLIIVAIVIRSLLKMSGESNNLMEMFIRIGGIITW